MEENKGAATTDKAPSDNANNEKSLPSPTTVAWTTQFKYVFRKNTTLLSRRPLTIFFLLVSGILSVVLGWVAGRDPDDPVYPPLTDCGTIPEWYYGTIYDDYKSYPNIQTTLNDEWYYGLPILCLMLGPMFNGIAVYITVHSELSNQLLGVLRVLGLRDSVYWLSWYVTFAILALVNSILAAITTKLLPNIHAFESIYFGGIFLYFWLLQLALISASFFIAALNGSAKRGTNWLIFAMLISVGIPNLILAARGIFWHHKTTFDRSYDVNATGDAYEFGTCHQPIVSDYQGHWYKTYEEREQQPFRDDEYFTGCYSKAGGPVDFWNPDRPKHTVSLVALFLFPYFHFNTIWGNFLGYTSMPGMEFTSKEVGLSPEALAIQSLPAIPDPFRGNSAMLPQGSMIQVKQYWDWSAEYSDSTCPHPNQTDANFCSNLYECDYVVNDKPTETPSTRVMFLCLLSLAVFYMLVAAYWVQVFSGANGKAQPYLFFLQPSYWLGSGRSAPMAGDDEDPSTARRQSMAQGGGIVVDSVRKKYRREEALKGVSMRMAIGEVTALLGHNGAGKTTLSHVLCCEIGATAGDIHVFGHSIAEDPYAVRRMVGLCKQDDYLWPDLTAREHLELFAGLRGVESSEIGHTVQKWLESVDLADALGYTSTFSGGMKRRLSVALATIGDRPVIILDEPTTGMDPVSRRFVWRHIDDIKDNRVVLLTTHAMEEADLLSDEVAILRKGELAAYGSPLSLKSNLGSVLQFSILVDKTNVEKADQLIRTFYKDAMSWVEIDSGDAGNISVNISKIRPDDGGDGVSVKLLSDFVAWLEGEDSPVTEYGFSNSSLEEVFLKVTGEEKIGTDNTNVNQVARGCCNCFGQREEALVEAQEIGNGAGKANQVAEAEELAAFQPHLEVVNQTHTLFLNFWTRAWTGRGSIVSWVIHGLLLCGTVLVGFTSADAWNPINAFAMPTVTLSILITTVIAPIYADRAEGIFYLMRSQGLLTSSYFLSSNLYAFSVALVYYSLVLVGLWATPIFRDPNICGEFADDCRGYLGDPQVLTETSPIERFLGVYNGEPVVLSAVRSPSGVGMVIGLAVVSAICLPGLAMASSYLPGYKLPIIFVSFLSIISGVWPLIQIFFPLGEELTIACSNSTNPNNVCVGNFDEANVNADFLNCVGVELNSHSGVPLSTLCIPYYAALLPQFGIFQALSMAYYSEIKFQSEPPGYVEEVLIPSIRGGECHQNVCKFPHAIKLYWLNLVFMIIGSIILFLIGWMMATVVAFPNAFVIHAKEVVRNVFCCIRPKKCGESDDIVGDGEELEEVCEERQRVDELVRPFMSSPTDCASEINYEAIPRHDIPPVIMHRIQKTYPSLGGRPPKIALKCLDLHVRKGEVLGFLGKNGAGKTTALKILSGAHDPTGGTALLAGYDCALERNFIFTRLGNCPQFDVVWKEQTVRQHLEFFAGLKGLPRSKIKATARCIATAVGLGAPRIYRRNAGALSGGMRRRLTIAMSLLGSPSVLIMDEPTTGLDPSTRSEIWNLINSFAKADRSTIITTHSMIEADTLCNRIAIIAHGDLKVVGTQQLLKDKFGSGYLLQLNLVKSSPENQARAMAFVKKRIHTDAELGTKQAKTLHIRLPRDLDLQRVFKALYSAESATEGNINQFLLSQSSLEDVFVALGE